MSDGFGHENPYEGQTNDWITPKYIIDALGPFDLDPCASATQPWPTAAEHFGPPETDGLKEDWYGNVYCNPPYGPNTAVWIQRLAEHGNGIALIFARVETRLWQDVIFPTATAYLFPAKRIMFCRPDGTQPKSSSGAPSALIAWGTENAARLRRAVDTGKLPGAYFGPAHTIDGANNGNITVLDKED
jgi:hypothetical protein